MRGNVTCSETAHAEEGKIIPQMFAIFIVFSCVRSMFILSLLFSLN